MTTALALGLALAMTEGLRADDFGSGANAFTVDFVTVGDPGNADDSGTTGNYSSPYGGVAYEFRIGTYEISREMITKASTSGSLGITLADMTSNGGNVATHPATGVTWNEAARFVNWLNTSKGYAAAYKFALQPGDGGYDPNADVLLWESGDAGYDANNRYRNANAYYVLPSENEWYKAAYYSGSGTTYYDYALGSDSIPTAISAGASGAVYDQTLSQGPAEVGNAGGLSPYGTMGQGGNVDEWAESASDGLNNSSSEDRVLRGGNWAIASNILQSSFRFSNVPTYVNLSIGFRVASVPEPTDNTAAIAALNKEIKKLKTAIKHARKKAQSAKVKRLTKKLKKLQERLRALQV